MMYVAKKSDNVASNKFIKGIYHRRWIVFSLIHLE